MNNKVLLSDFLRVFLSILLAMLLPSSVSGLRAHEIPTDVVIHSILKAESDKLNFMVRVPLQAMRDVNFPENGPGYLVISEADETLRDAATIWIAQEVSLFEDGKRLDDWEIAGVRVSLPSDRSFDNFEDAYTHLFASRLPDDTNLYREQAMLDVLIEYPINSATSEWSIEPRFARLGLQTTTVVRYVHSAEIERVFEFSSDPGVVSLDPSWQNAFFRFVRTGIAHILDGVDHLLFVLCLLIPYRRIRPLVAIVTSFTVAHSITLIASAFGLVPAAAWFPPLIETLIAASIVYMAIENIIGSRWQRRWLVAFAFGLVHGFGFSFALSETLQFAGSHLLTSLLAFNLGVEIGQLLVVLIAVPILNVVFRTKAVEKTGTIILSVLLAHGGWHWMSGRATELWAYPFSWPVINQAFLAYLIRWTMLIIVVGSTVWLLLHAYRRFLQSDEESSL